MKTRKCWRKKPAPANPKRFLEYADEAHPFALIPDLPQRIESGTYQALETKHIRTGFAPLGSKIGAVLEMDWYMAQMVLISRGKLPTPKFSPWKVLLKTLWANGTTRLSTGRP